MQLLFELRTHAVHGCNRAGLALRGTATRKAGRRRGQTALSASRSRQLLRTFRCSNFSRRKELTQQRQSGALQQTSGFLRHLVAVLLHKGDGRVDHRPGVVPHAKLVVALLRRVGQKAWVLLVGLVHAGHQFLVAGLAQAALVVEHRQDAADLVLDQVQAVLIVRELDKTPFDFLFLVLNLLHLEDILVELLLQGFVCVIDAQLLERVVHEALEPENIQHSNARPHQFGLHDDAHVDGAHNPVEELAVDGLGHRIPGIRGLQRSELLDVGLVAGHDRALCEGLRDGIHIQTQELSSLSQTSSGFDVVRHGTALTFAAVHANKVHLTQVQQRRGHVEQTHLVSGGEVQRLKGVLEQLELLLIVHALQLKHTTVEDVIKVLDGRKPPPFSLFLTPTGRQLVKNVEVSFAALLGR
mmetsp:Transcript_8251/g.13923  ORF Transcript_8251/g.13923 Transcript_8251/m.13923 type:complete len:412 (-) Transcript_8251:510-1745(-)